MATDAQPSVVLSDLQSIDAFNKTLVVGHSSSEHPLVDNIKSFLSYEPTLHAGMSKVGIFLNKLPEGAPLVQAWKPVQEEYVSALNKAGDTASKIIDCLGEYVDTVLPTMASIHPGPRYSHSNAITTLERFKRKTTTDEFNPVKVATIVNDNSAGLHEKLRSFQDQIDIYLEAHAKNGQAEIEALEFQVKKLRQEVDDMQPEVAKATAELSVAALGVVASFLEELTVVGAIAGAASAVGAGFAIYDAHQTLNKESGLEARLQSIQQASANLKQKWSNHRALDAANLVLVNTGVDNLYQNTLEICGLKLFGSICTEMHRSANVMHEVMEAINRSDDHRFIQMIHERANRDREKLLPLSDGLTDYAEYLVAVKPVGE